jgi:hypothetical protein
VTATRRLAAILAVDVVGYSRLMGENEPSTAAELPAALEVTHDLPAGKPDFRSDRPSIRVNAQSA